MKFQHSLFWLLVTFILVTGKSAVAQTEITIARVVLVPDCMGEWGVPHLCC
jgi:hypothetical protein